MKPRQCNTEYAAIPLFSSAFALWKKDKRALVKQEMTSPTRKEIAAELERRWSLQPKDSNIHNHLTVLISKNYMVNQNPSARLKFNACFHSQWRRE